MSRRRIIQIFVAVAVGLITFVVAVLTSGYIQRNTPDCFKSKFMEISHPIDEDQEVINSANVKNLTQIASTGYGSYGFPTMNGPKIMLSDDDQLLIISDVGFSYGSNLFYTVMTWELNKKEQALCYPVGSKGGKYSTYLIDVSADNRYILAERYSDFIRDCIDMDCRIMLDLLTNKRFQYSDKFSNLFDPTEQDHSTGTPRCTDKVHESDLYTVILAQLKEHECIRDIEFSFDHKFVVIAIVRATGKSIPLGWVEIWGIVDS